MKMNDLCQVLFADGRVQEAADMDFTQASSIVGGMVEVVRCPDGKRTMLINEEGKLVKLPVNRAATEIANVFPGDFIVGDVVVLSNSDAERVLNG